MRGMETWQNCFNSSKVIMLAFCLLLVALVIPWRAKGSSEHQPRSIVVIIVPSLCAGLTVVLQLCLWFHRPGFYVLHVGVCGAIIALTILSTLNPNFYDEVVTPEKYVRYIVEMTFFMLMACSLVYVGCSLFLLVGENVPLYSVYGSCLYRSILSHFKSIYRFCDKMNQSPSSNSARFKWSATGPEPPCPMVCASGCFQS